MPCYAAMRATLARVDMRYADCLLMPRFSYYATFTTRYAARCISL